MTKTLLIATSLMSLAIATPALALHNQRVVSYEEEMARQEQDFIMTQPIAGRDNNLWHDYQTDVAEARQELRKDLDDVTDSEDRRDAWEEYRSELVDARHDYVKEMREKGYRAGQVSVED